LCNNKFNPKIKPRWQNPANALALRVSVLQDLQVQNTFFFLEKRKRVSEKEKSKIKKNKTFGKRKIKLFGNPALGVFKFKS